MFSDLVTETCHSVSGFGLYFKGQVLSSLGVTSPIFSSPTKPEPRFRAVQPMGAYL